MLDRAQFQSDISNVSLEVTLNGTEISILAIHREMRSPIKYRKQSELCNEH